ncbi:VCBS repeat protein [Maribacter vaceletii]|uniref:VCBS repeat protein n=1 Tax=Maribacter vaceletii TaxID=1206816 RepID=A0A495EC73_9FLAO|nr:VCBS repeat-containing protein [Maribacter vaceletii]RKR14475.1 VCBS repeat protein [Maribacter vaceletii]
MVSKIDCIYMFLFLVLCSCNKKSELSGLNSANEAIFTKLSQEQTGINFANELYENMKFNGVQYEYYYNGSGLAVADFNNDGLKDVFFVSTLKKHQIFLNQGDLKFKDVTSHTGITFQQKFSGGVTIVDINNDGWMDVYISNSGKYKGEEKRRNKLYINMGAKGEHKIPTFTEQGKKYGLDIADCSTQATFFDYDKDGDLDMYLLNHFPSTYPDNTTIEELLDVDGGVSNDRLLRNDNNYFTDISKKAGIIHNRLEYGLGIAIGDVNNDTWPDIYVSNDYSGKDHLYMNNMDGTFTDRILEATKNISFFAMGNDMSDINNDGWLDIMTVDMMGESNYDIKTSMSGMNPKKFQNTVDIGLHHQYMYNALQINSGFLNKNNVPIFSNLAQLAGVSRTDWSWAPLFFDMDNDGFKDLFVSNGIKRDFRNNDFVNYMNKKQDTILASKKFSPKDYISDLLDKMPTRKKENFFFKNNDGLNFTKMNKVWGDQTLTSSNGAVYADMDNDGDLDIIVNNTDDPAFILKNNSKELGLGHSLTITLKGPQKNRDGIGARVVVTTDENKQTQELYFSRGFMSAMSRELHFGLGTSSKATVEIIWPDNKHQLLKNVTANQLLTINYSDAVVASTQEKKKLENTLFSKNTVKGLNYMHKENDFDDFARESLLPHKMSNEGPSLAVGDINGDGLEDIHVGGALAMQGVIYIQNSDGSFALANETLMEKESAYEDVASEFIDVDNDGDLDLYIVSGGNENLEGSVLLRDRLYINDGKGNFTKTSGALPKIAISGSCIKAIDYDNDGDKDLFIGGRQVPGKYPAPAKSYLLQNNSIAGKVIFEEAKLEVNNLWQNLGMVTDAVWIDLNEDGFLDLITAGEWMPIRVFENDKGKDFTEKTKEYGLEETNGWWYSLAVHDFDKDGDKDIIAGNLGLNYKYKASNTAPFEVFASDFDASGSNDIVLSYYDDKKLVPVRGRECSSRQMPFLKEKFPTYDAYGKATVTDIFDDNQLKKSVHLKANTFETTLFKNEGGKFVSKKLETGVQTSSVNDILVDDMDGDGFADILMAGNLYGSEVETPRNDAAHGLFLKGNAEGDFKLIKGRESGLMIDGEVKYIKTIIINKRKNIIVAKNNQALEIIAINPH